MSAITFAGVSKYFYRHAGRMLLRERLTHLLRGSTRERFYALQDVSFAVGCGESLAIIGHNGAGKSTLLNIATGLCAPSAGTTKVNGRVAALLELGSGFHPDLTGAENVHLNAATLGMTRRQARACFDQIVEFSGVGEFIDQPLRTYSSGMSMRLAFAVAINVDPDVLIVDEVLGVGDHSFASKCLEKILEFRRAGKAMLCASHSFETLENLCDRCLWLDHGRVVKAGPVRDVLQAYLNSPAAPIQAAVTVNP
jgi:ABC-type polysaccharide/polyol phosphate transport system ATPase subunit